LAQWGPELKPLVWEQGGKAPEAAEGKAPEADDISTFETRK